MNKEIAYEFIEQRIKDLKVNLSKECKKYNISYQTVYKVIHEKKDCKVSMLLFFATICQCELEDLFRTRY